MKTTVKRRVTEFCKSAIFWVIMGLSDSFTAKAFVALMISTIGVAQNNDSETCDNIFFQTGHLMSRKLVK